MAFRAGVLIALCAGSAVANPQFAAAQDSSSDKVQPLRFVISAEPSSYQWSSPNFPVKSPYGSPGSVKLLVPPTCFWGGTRFEVPRFS